MDISINKKLFQQAASLVAYLFGITAIILLLLWLLQYRGGFELDSDNSNRIFNVHVTSFFIFGQVLPFLMFFGFILFSAEVLRKSFKFVAQYKLPQCCENPPSLSSSCGAGHVEELGGLKSYISGSPDSKISVLLVSDVFGYEAPNLRKLADKVAAAGFYVVVPDFIHGDPFVPENAKRPFPIWIKDHGPDQVFEDAKPIIEAVKSKGVSKIGAAGFCWGAKVTVELAKYSYVQAAVLLHPSLVTCDDIQGVKVPISILGAEIDNISPPELLKQFEEVLDSKPEVDSFVKIFPGVAHGWSVRYTDGDEEAVKRAEEAHQNMLDWFGKYLK